MAVHFDGNGNYSVEQLRGSDREGLMQARQQQQQQLAG